MKFGVPILRHRAPASPIWPVSGVQESKSYYVTIKEMNEMGDGVYSKRLRVAGNVQPGSIQRQGTHVEFTLAEQGRTLNVVYSGTEAPPDTFKDNAQALGRGQLRARWRIPCQATSGQVCLQVCAGAARSNRRTAGGASGESPGRRACYELAGDRF